MFEIGFAELFLLGVIALLVVGPDRLPALARTVGVWVGRAQRLVGQVRADIEREVRADELRKAAREYSPTGMLGDMRKEVEAFAGEVSKPVDLDAEKAEAEKTGSGAAEAGNAAAGKAKAASTGKESAESGKGEASGAGADGSEDAAAAAALATEPVPGDSGAHHQQAADDPEADRTEANGTEVDGTDTPDKPEAELVEEVPATETDHGKPESADAPPPAEPDERRTAG